MIPVEKALSNVPRAKLVVEAVSKTFATKRGGVEALEKVSLQVNEGEFVCLVGRSGCGKSTLLNLIRPKTTTGPYPEGSRGNGKVLPQAGRIGKLYARQPS